MKSTSEISAGDIVREDFVALDSNSKLLKAKSKMEEHKVRSIPVLQNKEFKGMVSYRELIKEAHSNPDSTKLKKVIHQPPKISGEESLPSLASKRINSGRKKFALLDGRELKGLIGEKEIVFSVSELRELKGLKIEDLSEKDIIKIVQDEGIDKARDLMVENDILRLPVVDSGNKLVGIVRELDILKELTPMERMDYGDLKGEKESFSDVPVREIMSRTPLSVEENISINKAIEEMSKNSSPELIICEKKEPIQILTLRDIIEYLAKFSKQDFVRVTLSGVDTKSEKAAIHNKISKVFRGPLGRVLDNPEELNVHYKKSEKEGKRHRYELSFKLFSELGTVVVEEEGWELLDVVDSALDELEKVVKKKKNKRKEKR